MSTKWTLVTGGAKRLGASICRRLAQEGHSILIQYQNSLQEANKTALECRQYGIDAACIYGDFMTSSSTQQFTEEVRRQFPNIQNLINNVGNYLQLSLENTSTNDWEQLYQINVHAPFACIHALLPSIKEHKGNIINIGTAGVLALHANGPAPAYRATKTTLWMMTRLFARELAPYQVRVNMVSPGQLEISEDAPGNLNTLPMQRLGSCDEVANVIAFLLAPENSYITGQDIEIAGALGL